jgi:phosphoglycolate phosphatase
LYKYIVFDFDGTLVDSKDVYISAYNQLAAKYKSRPIEVKDIPELKKLSVLGRASYLNLSVSRIPFIAVDMIKLYKNGIKDLKMIEGTKKLLDDLAGLGYRLAIISSNSENNIREFLEFQQIDSISEVICSSNVFGKDRIIKKFLKKCRLNNSEIIYIGDESRDVLACKKLGVKIIGVTWGYDFAETLKESGPDFIINNPDDILKIIDTADDFALA